MRRESAPPRPASAERRPFMALASAGFAAAADAAAAAMLRALITASSVLLSCFM